MSTQDSTQGITYCTWEAILLAPEDVQTHQFKVEMCQERTQIKPTSESKSQEYSTPFTSLSLLWAYGDCVFLYRPTGTWWLMWSILGGALLFRRTFSAASCRLCPSENPGQAKQIRSLWRCEHMTTRPAGKCATHSTPMSQELHLCCPQVIPGLFRSHSSIHCHLGKQLHCALSNIQWKWLMASIWDMFHFIFMIHPSKLLADHLLLDFFFIPYISFIFLGPSSLLPSSQTHSLTNSCVCYILLRLLSSPALIFLLFNLNQHFKSFNFTKISLTSKFDTNF